LPFALISWHLNCTISTGIAIKPFKGSEICKIHACGNDENTHYVRQKEDISASKKKYSYAQYIIVVKDQDE